MAQSTHETRDVVIIGGGITGLAAAYYLQEAAREAGRRVDYTLVEASERLGGKILTEHVDGFTIEGGPDCVIGQKPWAAELARKLGLGDQLMGTNEDRRKTFVLNHGRLTALPDGVMLIVPTRITPFVTSTLISWPGKIRMGMDLLIPRRTGTEDESVASFVRRRLGQEALDKIAEPLMGGIHVSDPETQSLLGTFPRFRELEKKHRSLILGMLAGKRQRTANGRAGGQNGHGGAGAANIVQPAPHPAAAGRALPAPTTPFITLQQGLGQLVAALSAVLTGEILTNTRALRITREAPPGQAPGEASDETPARASDGSEATCYRVVTADGQTIYARALVLTTPAYASGQLVGKLAPDLSGLLGQIRYVSTATVSLGYDEGDLTRPLNGFGLVIPRGEGRQISACTWTSTKFNCRAPAGKVLVRCFVGGPGKEELVELADEALVALARREVRDIMGLHAAPVVTRLFRWRQANPQYDVGHLERVRKMRESCATQPGLYIAGSAYDGVGVPDCVRQGKEAAGRAWAFVGQGEAAPRGIIRPES